MEFLQFVGIWRIVLNSLDVEVWTNPLLFAYFTNKPIKMLSGKKKKKYNIDAWYIIKLSIFFTSKENFVKCWKFLWNSLTYQRQASQINILTRHFCNAISWYFSFVNDLCIHCWRKSLQLPSEVYIYSSWTWRSYWAFNDVCSFSGEAWLHNIYL